MKKTIILAVAVCAAGANAQSFTEGFEGGPAGWFNGVGSTTSYGNTAGGDALAFGSGTWHALNASLPQGTAGWFTNTAVFAAHGGTKMANANYNSVSGDNTINTFMMSVVRTFNNGDTISFWARTPDIQLYADRLMLKLSTNGASTAAGDFSTTLLTINSALTVTGFPNVWTQYNVTLSGLGGPTSGRFAFNYNVTNGGPLGANSDFIGVDDVVYTSNPVPEPASMAVLGLGALALIRRRRAK